MTFCNDKLVKSVLENCQFIEKLLGGTEMATTTTTKKSIYMDITQINVRLLQKICSNWKAVHSAKWGLWEGANLMTADHGTVNLK